MIFVADSYSEFDLTSFVSTDTLVVTTKEADYMNEIKVLRGKLGLNQEGFAKRLGVSRPSVQRWETGKMRPSPLALARINELKAIKQPVKGTKTK